MRRRAIAAVALVAASWSPSSASAGEFGTIAATVAGVVAGGVLASAVVAGTTATVVGSAIGGGIACWWYEGADGSGYDALPKKSALRTAPSSNPSSDIVPVAASQLHLVAAKR